MKAIRCRIKAVNPLIISSKRGDANMVNTKPYIPGNSILGVFASLYIKNEKLKDAHKDANFYRWFLKDNLIFTNAYIIDDDRRYFPNPYSIKNIKYNGGSLYDLMFGDIEKPTKSCETFTYIKGLDIYEKSVKKSISFHHAMENKSSKDSAIFNYESIAENQIFEGNIIGESDHIDEFCKFFKKKFGAYVGLSKNSQYGKIEIELKEMTNYISEIATNIEPDDTNIVMTFLSDAVIYNENGFSTSNIDDLKRVIGVEIKDSFIRKDITEQFVGIWKLKSPSETVFAAGSCFKLDKLPDNYEEIQIKGIGEKTNEGFGRVVFGWQNGESKYSNTIENEETPAKPNGEPPKIVKKIILGIIKERLKDVVISKAIDKAHSFAKPPTKSLCGKLQSLSSDINKFQENLDKVIKNKPAKDQLEKCNNNNIRLLEYLKTDKFIDIDSLLNGIDGLDNFTDELKGSKTLEKDMKRLHLRTFFNFMRKTQGEKNEPQL